MTQSGKKTGFSEERNALEKLENEAAILKNFINRSPAIACSYAAHPSWRVGYVSDNIQLLGYTPEDFYRGDVTLLNLIHPADLQRVVDELSFYTSQKKHEEFSQEYRIFKTDGTWLWVDARTSVTYGYSGEVSSLQTLFNKITAQKNSLLELGQAKEDAVKANEALTKLWDFLIDILDNIPPLVYVKDPQSRFIIANQAIVDIMGAKSQEELRGKTDFDFYPKENAQEFFDDEQLLMTGKMSIIEKEEHVPDQRGGMRWIHTVKRPLCKRSGEVIGIIGLGYDITLRKKEEKEKEKIQ